MNTQTSFLQEDNGNYSLIRLIPFILCLTSVIFGILAVLLDSYLASDLATTFLTASCGSLAAKVIQKPLEDKV